MSAGFTDILHLFVFLLAVWSAGRVLRLLHVSPVLGELAVGMILGPQVADWVPFTHALETLGSFGVTLLIFESGMHLNLGKLREFGPSSLLVATIGTLSPIVLGMAVMVGLGFDAYPDGIAVGAALAPTSVGIALQLLTEAKLLDSDFGQVIVTAAFLDDIFSIVSLVVLLDTASGNVTPWGLCSPFLYSTLFVVMGTLCAVYIVRVYLPPLLKRIEFSSSASVQPRDELHLAFMTSTLLAAGYLASFVGSHLLGAFMAGVMFTDVHRSMLVWKRQFKKVIHWLVRLFFCSTVAFGIPVSQLFNVDSLWKGVILGAFGAVAPKLLSGAFLSDKKWVVGWAMVARGEFAYLVAETASETAQGDGKLMSKEAYAVVVWALLITTVVAPFTFRNVLGSYSERTRDPNEELYDTVELRVEGHRHTGLLREVIDTLTELELEVQEAHIETDGDTDAEVFVVRERGKMNGNGICVDKMHELKHHLIEAMDDVDAQVMIRPLTLAATCASQFNLDGKTPRGNARRRAKSPSGRTAVSRKERITLPNVESSNVVVDIDGLSGDATPIRMDDEDSQVERNSSSVQRDSSVDRAHTVEIRLMSSHAPHVFTEILEAIADLGLHVQRAQMQDMGGTDTECIYAIDDEVHSLEERRQEIHDRLKQVFTRHSIKGSVMVKMLEPFFLDEHRNFRQRFLSSPRSKEESLGLVEVCVDVSRGATGDDLLHLVTLAFEDLCLDIVSADIDIVQGIDVFFAEDPTSIMSSCSRDQRRNEICSHVRQSLFAAGTFAEVTVSHCESPSPMKKPRVADLKLVPEMSLDYASNGRHAPQTDAEARASQQVHMDQPRLSVVLEDSALGGKAVYTSSMMDLRSAVPVSKRLGSEERSMSRVALSAADVEVNEEADAEAMAELDAIRNAAVDHSDPDAASCSGDLISPPQTVSPSPAAGGVASQVSPELGFLVQMQPFHGRGASALPDALQSGQDLSNLMMVHFPAAGAGAPEPSPSPPNTVTPVGAEHQPLLASSNLPLSSDKLRSSPRCFDDSFLPARTPASEREFLDVRLKVTQMLADQWEARRLVARANSASGHSRMRSPGAKSPVSPTAASASASASGRASGYASPSGRASGYASPSGRASGYASPTGTGGPARLPSQQARRTRMQRSQSMVGIASRVRRQSTSTNPGGLTPGSRNSLFEAASRL